MTRATRKFSPSDEVDFIIIGSGAAGGVLAKELSTAGTSATTGNYCWGYQYSYDAWGNLLSQAGWTPTYTGCSETVMAPVTANGNNYISAFAYDASGNTSSDGTYTYLWNGESQLKSAASVSYIYDGDGRRAAKVGSKLYWYGSGGEILAETDSSGNTLNEYAFFGGKRIGMLPAGSTAQFYAEDSLGSSRIVTSNTGVVIYDADFAPYGGERPYVNTSTNVHKFEGKERDTESGNDDFGARYYSNRFGRWLSSDWSAVPKPIPYANFDNPQSLNLYSMVADDPESFADLDGHGWWDDLKQRLLNGWKYGEFVTNGQLPAAFDKERAWLAKNARNGNGSALSPSQLGALNGATDAQVNSLYRGYARTIMLKMQLYGGDEAISSDPQDWGRAENGALVPLVRLHSDSTIMEGNKTSFDYWQTKSSEEIIQSLKEGSKFGELTVSPSGTVMDGNTRIKILEERGINVNELPRTIFESEPPLP